MDEVYFTDLYHLLANCPSFLCTYGEKVCLSLLAMNTQETSRTKNETQKAQQFGFVGGNWDQHTKIALDVFVDITRKHV